MQFRESATQEPLVSAVAWHDSLGTRFTTSQKGTISHRRWRKNPSTASVQSSALAASSQSLSSGLAMLPTASG